jgi:hypothetical protein
MKSTIALLALLAAPPVFAQEPSPFRALDLPAPNVYRSASGRPGPRYWQQRVDYRIDATLDTDRHEVRAQEAITYTNNSPDTLTSIWMHLEQNICAAESITSTLNQPPLVFGASAFDFSCKGFKGGVTLQNLSSSGRALKRVIDGTIMRVDLPAPLAPGQSVTIDVAWSFPVPEYGAARMGRDGSLYEIAQWYPRVAVYDDVRGWNHEPYIGAGEFYLEYGRFDVSITLPARFVLVATGRLQNPEAVLTAQQRERLARALRSVEPVAVITAAEAGRPVSRPQQTGSLTWRFAADSVRDFAFAAGPELRWDASGFNGVLINTLYRPNASMWTEANRMARAAIQHFSEQWYPYPYPHATTIEGPIEGMEYPMLTFVPKGVTREDLHWVLMHEFGHEWFPMLVGSNERLYPWMDEGFNTFIDLEAVQHYFPGTAYADTVTRIALNLYPEHAIEGHEQALITRPIEVHDLFWLGYRKPSLMLNLLRYEVLGRDRFDGALREYIEAWAFKHPTPADFFRVMRDQSGMDLDWFWRGWVYTAARLDQAVDSIATRADGGQSVIILSNGTMIMPAELKLTFADETVQTVRLPVDMWNLGRRFEYRVPGSKRVIAAEVDPRAVYPDTNRANNRWPRTSP